MLQYVFVLAVFSVFEFEIQELASKPKAKSASLHSLKTAIHSKQNKLQNLHNEENPKIYSIFTRGYRERYAPQDYGSYYGPQAYYDGNSDRVISPCPDVLANKGTSEEDKGTQHLQGSMLVV